MAVCLYVFVDAVQGCLNHQMFFPNQGIHNNGVFRLCVHASGREVLTAVIYLNIHAFR